MIITGISAFLTVSLCLGSVSGVPACPVPPSAGCLAGEGGACGEVPEGPPYNDDLPAAGGAPVVTGLNYAGGDVHFACQGGAVGDRFDCFEADLDADLYEISVATYPALVRIAVSFPNSPSVRLFDDLGAQVPEAALSGAAIGQLGGAFCWTIDGPGGGGSGTYYVGVAGELNLDYRPDLPGCEGTSGSIVDYYDLSICLSDPSPPLTPAWGEPGTMSVPPAADDWEEAEDAQSDIESDKAPWVYPFNGEFYREEVDLRIPGWMLDFVWDRKYRSRLGRTTAMGNNWDFSYNIYIEDNGDNLILYDGNSRSDVYYPTGDGRWANREFARTIEIGPGGQYIVTFIHTDAWVLHPLDGSPRAGKISEARDRNGNTLTFGYDAAGRLTTITDNVRSGGVGPGRTVTVQYNAAGFIAAIVDFTGRVVSYAYYDGIEPGGSFGDLKSVTYPAVVGTPNGNDFPLGKSWTYTYTSGSAHPALDGNLLTIADAEGRVFLTNSYSPSTNPENFEFDRVAAQNVGGGLYHYTYIAEPPGESGAVRVIVNDPLGHVSELAYDEFNRLLTLREFTGTADPAAPVTDAANRPSGRLRPEAPALFETRLSWNAGSRLAEIVHPNGNLERFEYDAGAVDPQSRHNRVRSIQAAGPSGRGVAWVGEREEITRWHRVFNFPVLITDARETTTIIEYDEVGNPTRVDCPIMDVCRPCQKSYAPPCDYTHAYNEFGQPLRTELSNGAFEEFTYYDSGPMTGRLKDHVRAVDAAGGLTTTYEYDAAGNVTAVIDPKGQRTEYIVNALDQVVREIAPAPFLHRTDYFYDANDNLTRVDAQNVDDQGQVDPNESLTTAYQYDTLDRLTRVAREVDAGRDAIAEYEYDVKGNLTLIRSPEAVAGRQPDNVVCMMYDERDLPYRTTRGCGGPAASTEQYDYDGNGNTTRRRSGLEGTPRELQYAYDGFDNCTRVAGPEGGEAFLEYDPNDNLTRVEVFGKLIDGQPGAPVLLSRLEFTYNQRNDVIEAKQDHFDPATGAPIGDGESWVSIGYTGALVDLIVDDRGSETRFEYDLAGRRTKDIDAKGNSRQYIYDANSNIVTVTDVDRSDIGDADETYVSRFVYDELDRLTETLDNAGKRRQHRYDSRGNRVKTVDALGNAVSYAYDGLDRLLAVTRVLTADGTGAGAPAGTVTTRRAWDDNSRLIGETDDGGRTTRYEYDALNRQTRTLYADGTASESVYDVHDNIVWQRDANGSVVSSMYDLLDRLVSRSVLRADGVLGTTFETYQYDGLSRLVRAEDDDSLVTRRYDSLSNAVSETQRIGGIERTATATFDGAGNLLEMVYPGGRRVTRTYDALDRVSDISDDLIASIARFDYAGGGLRTARRDFANGVRYVPKYDNMRRKTRTTYTRDPDGAAQTLDDRTYAWDAVHNKTSETDLLNGRSRTYHYDSLYRMIESRVTGGGRPEKVARYDLDGAGNRTSATGAGGGRYVRSAEVPEPADEPVNQYTATPLDRRMYDRNGNLTRRVVSGDADGDGDVDLDDHAAMYECMSGPGTAVSPGCEPFDYDADADVDLEDVGAFQRGFGRDRVVSGHIVYDYRSKMVEFVDLCSGQRHVYRYDALGRRIAKIVDVEGEAVETHYRYYGWQVIEEQDGAGATLATYVVGNVLDETLTVRRGGADYYYLADEMGSVTALADAGGTVVERYEYDDYGRPAFYDGQGKPIERSAYGNALLFTGREYDAETGLYYFRTRYLDPATGRFTTRDVIGIWGDPANLGNGYTYVGNNPASYIDPLGLETVGIVFDPKKHRGKGSWDTLFGWWDDLKGWLGGGSDVGDDRAIGAIRHLAGQHLIRARRAALNGDCEEYYTMMRLYYQTQAIIDELLGELESMWGWRALEEALDWVPFGRTLDHIFNGGSGWDIVKSVGWDIVSLLPIGKPLKLIKSFGKLIIRGAGKILKPVIGAVGGLAGKRVTAAVGKLTGQIHHAISKVIHAALETREKLKGKYKHRDKRFTTQAKDGPSHRGYQDWHRKLDKEVADEIRGHPKWTPKDFEDYLKGRYGKPDLRGRFPRGL